MAELKFDHTKNDSFLEAIGMSEEDMKDLNMKFAKMSHYIITDTPQESKLIEKIAETFSYNELLLACTFFVTDKTAQIVQENPLITVLAAIRELKKEK